MGAAPALIGRDALAARVLARIERGAIVALVGPAGVGKSALARAVASSYAAGATRRRVVMGGELASTENETDDEGEGLLVVVDEGGDAAAVARAFPEAAVLVAARRAPAVATTIVDVTPLAIAASDDDVEGCDAWALFAERVRAVRQDFGLAPRERPVARALLARTDGVPLAIELLAAQARGRSLAALLARVEAQSGAERFDAPIVAAARAAAADLSEGARATLRRVVATPAEIDEPTAEALFGADAGAHLEELRDRGLLVARSFSGTGVLHRVPAAVAAAIEEEIDPALRAETGARHARHFAARAERGGDLPADVLLAHASAALARLPAGEPGAARGLLRAISRLVLRAGANPALAAALDAAARRSGEGVELQLRAVRGLVACASGEPEAGAAALDRALAEAAGADATARAEVARAAGAARFLRGHLSEARAALAEALAATPGDPEIQAELAGVLVVAGDVGEAERVLDAAIARAREGGAEEVEAWAELRRAEIRLDAGDVGRARVDLARIVEGAAARGDRRLFATALGDEGLAALLEGDPARAEARFRESAAALASMGLGGSAATMRWALGLAHELDGRGADAELVYEEAIILARVSTNDLARGLALAGLGRVLADRGDEDRARARLHDAARAFEDTGDELRAAVVHLAESHLAAPGTAAIVDAPEIAALARRSAEVRIALELARRRGPRPTTVPPIPKEMVAIGGLAVARDGSALRTAAGDVVRLETRGAPKRILAHLVGRWLESPGATSTLDEIFAAGWPEVRVSARSAASRVYVAVSTLRTLGLGPSLARTSDGYRLEG